MKKDKSITYLLNKLKLSANFNEIEFVDNWDADLCAIGFKRGSKRVYLSSYNFASGMSDGYDYDFELINEEQLDKVNVIKTGRNIKEVELIADIKEFLEV